LIGLAAVVAAEVRSTAMNLKERFDRSVGLAWLRQERVRARVADGAWWVDPQNGVARLFDASRKVGGPDVAIQVLGSEAVEGRYWLWEWANPQNAVPPTALKGAEALRALGTRDAIRELVEGEVGVDNLVNADTLGLIAVCELNAPGYFRHDVRDELRIPCLLDESWRTPDPTDLREVPATLQKILQAQLPVTNFLHVVEGLLDGLHIPRAAIADGIAATGRSGERLRITAANAELKIELDEPNA
jgi:hypothetical protein